MKGVAINYTFASNLKKTPDMAAGAVTFYDDKKVINVHCDKDNSIINRLTKTKEERAINLRKVYELHMK